MAVRSEMPHMDRLTSQPQAAIAQLGERQTEDLQVPGPRQIFHCGGVNFPSHKFKSRSRSPGHLVPPPVTEIITSKA